MLRAHATAQRTRDYGDVGDSVREEAACHVQDAPARAAREELPPCSERCDPSPRTRGELHHARHGRSSSTAAAATVERKLPKGAARIVADEEDVAPHKELFCGGL